MKHRHPPNRLARSSSPYLLQHAHNPVDWHTWGEEAFAEARRRDVPIFLSVGYSTCHWCHVMERESFEDDATAKLMNELFVCIKLDREERPDVDELYMTATIAMHGHGGWPMSVFLEPASLRPFYCGTYFPPEDRHGGPPAFSRVLRSMSMAYAGRRAEVLEQAGRLADAVREQLTASDDRARLGTETVERAIASVLGLCDTAHGGFGLAPKFPQMAFVEFLLDAREVVDEQTRSAIDRCVRVSMDAMAMGGLHDHVGGGFHRYCVDADWTVPHFEKMLYDQAQMLSAYARAGRIYHDAWYLWIAGRVERYVRSRLHDPLGGYRSAEDAEVDGREGASYVWTPERVRAVLASGDAGQAIRWFGLDGPPNFRDPHHPDEPASWVLRLRERPPADGQDERYMRVLEALERDRASRPMPEADAKVVACWNGMMYLALAGMHGHDGATTDLSRDLARLVERLRDSDDALLRCAMGAVAHTRGLLEDYAPMIASCARLGLLEHARRLHAGAASAFRDETGLWYDTRAGENDLFVRAHSTHDGACPCGFSMMLHALLDLARATGQSKYARQTALALHAASARIDASPAGSVHSVRALLRLIREWGNDAGVMHALNPSGVNYAVRGDASRAAGSESVVRVFAGVERITLTRDQPAELWLRFVVAEGWHIALAGGDGGVRPLSIGTTGGRGVRVYFDLPVGEVLNIVGVGGVRVARGEFDVRVALEREGEWHGSPVLTATFQACGADSCLRPAIVELDISLDRG